jgi:hypothetical protein
MIMETITTLVVAVSIFCRSRNADNFKWYNARAFVHTAAPQRATLEIRLRE